MRSRERCVSPARRVPAIGHVQRCGPIARNASTERAKSGGGAAFQAIVCRVDRMQRAQAAWHAAPAAQRRHRLRRVRCASRRHTRDRRRADGRSRRGARESDACVPFRACSAAASRCRSARRRRRACAPACRARRRPSSCAASDGGRSARRRSSARATIAARDREILARDAYAPRAARTRVGLRLDRLRDDHAARSCPCRADARCRRAAATRAPDRDAAARSAACRRDCRCPDARRGPPACRRRGSRHPRRRPSARCPRPRRRVPASRASARHDVDALAAGDAVASRPMRRRRPSRGPRRSTPCSRLRECSGSMRASAWSRRMPASSSGTRRVIDRACRGVRGAGVGVRRSSAIIRGTHEGCR